MKHWHSRALFKSKIPNKNRVKMIFLQISILTEEINSLLEEEKGRVKIIWIRKWMYTRSTR